MIRIIFVLACFGFVLTLGGCTNSRVWKGPIVEPLRDGGGVVESGMYRGMPYVMASVNGSEPMKFLFDTGASFDLVTPKAAKELGLRAIGAARVEGASGLTKSLPFALADRVEFGPVAIEDMVFVIRDLAAVSPYFSEDIAGLIGITGLEEFTIDIDYPRRVVSITQERLSLDDPGTSVMYTLADGLLMVPVSFTDPEEPGSSRVVWSLLDSGNDRMYDLHTDEAKLFLDQSKLTGGHGAKGIHGIGRLHDAGPMRMGLQIGHTQLEGMAAAVSDVESRLDSTSLRNFHVKIDMKSKLVSFTRTDNAQRLVSTNRMGITNLWVYDGHRIDQTIGGSAAHLLGIRAFDEVMLIDGVEPNGLHVKTAYWAAGAEATTITLRIRRVVDDGWVDVVLPIDGSVEGIEERDAINLKSQKIEAELTGEDGDVIHVEMTPVESMDEH